MNNKKNLKTSSPGKINRPKKPLTKKDSKPILEAIESRRSFYLDSYKKSWRIAAIGLASTIVAIGTTIHTAGVKENNVYFATNEAGSLIKLIPLSEPNHKDETVSNWLTEALVDTFSFNYSNINTRLTKSTQAWFTDKGASELISNLKDNGTLELINDKKIIVSLATQNTPIVLRKGQPDVFSAYMWQLQVPAVITYRTETSESSANVLFTVSVSRRSILEDPKGLGISNILMIRQK